jgi:3,4-dihydroxy-2-butanone 4-phosphate synthase
MAKLAPAGVICEIALDDGRMARRDDLVKFCKKWNLKLITIADMQRYRTRLGLLNL